LSCVRYCVISCGGDRGPEKCGGGPEKCGGNGGGFEKYGDGGGGLKKCGGGGDVENVVVVEEMEKTTDRIEDTDKMRKKCCTKEID